METEASQLEQAIARDLDTCDLMLAIGDRKSKARAKRHHKACFAKIREWNREEPEMSDAEILAALGLATGGDS